MPTGFRDDNDNDNDDDNDDDDDDDDGNHYVPLQMGELAWSDVDSPLPPRSEPIFTSTAII